MNTSITQHDLQWRFLQALGVADIDKLTKVTIVIEQGKLPQVYAERHLGYDALGNAVGAVSQFEMVAK